jgi:hypothetical protein
VQPSDEDDQNVEAMEIKYPYCDAIVEDIVAYIYPNKYGG